MEISKGLFGFLGSSIETPDAEVVPIEPGATQQGGLELGESLTQFLAPKESEGTPPPTPQKKINPRAEAERLIHNLIFTESGGVHREKDGTLRMSEKGARGITQLMPHTAKDPGYGIKPLQNDSPKDYVRFGKDYLSAMINVFGDVEKGVAAYNAGVGTVRKAIERAGKEGRDWKELLPKETQDYIKKVK